MERCEIVSVYLTTAREFTVFSLKRTVFVCWTLLTVIQMIVCDGNYFPSEK